MHITKIALYIKMVLSFFFDKKPPNISKCTSEPQSNIMSMYTLVWK